MKKEGWHPTSMFSVGEIIFFKFVYTERKEGIFLGENLAYSSNNLVRQPPFQFQFLHGSPLDDIIYFFIKQACKLTSRKTWKKYINLLIEYHDSRERYIEMARGAPPFSQSWLAENGNNICLEPEGRWIYVKLHEFKPFLLQSGT